MNINIWRLDGFSVNVDPNGAFRSIETQHIHEMCGIIPTFFAKAVMNSDDDFDEVIEGMDQEYGFGGFQHPFGGTIKNHKYISSYEEDEDLDALLVMNYRTEDHATDILPSFKMYQFQYGIVAVEDVPSGKTKIARFD